MRSVSTKRDGLEKIEALLSLSPQEQQEDIKERVSSIIDEVRRKGDEALAHFTSLFDGVHLKPEQFEVKGEEMEAAFHEVDERVITALKKARDKISSFHSRNLQQSWYEVSEEGSLLGQRVTPIERVGAYVPGGTAYYPSTVLMNLIPAKVASCSFVCLCTPPSHGGTVHPVILVAASLAGADKVFRIGGAQAIAALAWGTETIPRVDKIVGPGNVYVAMAKSLVFGQVDIDMVAGPSEIMVVADESAQASVVASDLLSQAEHDSEASAILITPSRELAQQVHEEVKLQLKNQPRRDIIEQSLERNGMIILVGDLDEAMTLVNIRAPEHLELQVKEPWLWLSKVKHAGAIFLGASSPEVVGDYMAGPNHVLPTGRRARFSSPLSADDFRKKSSLICYSHRQLMQEAEDVIQLARMEGLNAHASAIEVRIEKCLSPENI